MRSAVLLGTILLNTCLTGCNELQVNGPSSRESSPIVNGSPSNTSTNWVPATYRGLRMGKSSLDDMLNILGTPKNFVRPSEVEDAEKKAKSGFETTYIYKDDIEFHGTLMVGIEFATSNIIWVRLRPASFTKEQAIVLLGNDFVIRKYAYDDCVQDESVPIFESESGPVTLYEYPHRGAFFGLRDDIYVDEISYTARQPGAKFSRCNPIR